MPVLNNYGNDNTGDWFDQNGASARPTTPTQSGLVPRDQFDAQGYLAANPDVAKAISQGAFNGDPYQHYLQFGYQEKRNGATKAAPAATTTTTAATKAAPAATTTTTAATQNTYGGSANLDPAAMRQQTIDGFKRLGFGVPSEAQIQDVLKYASRPDKFSDGTVHAGVNDYWLTRVATGSESADPRLAGTDTLLQNYTGALPDSGFNADHGFAPNTASSGDINSIQGLGSMPATTLPPFDPSTIDLKSDPSYQFRLNQGLGAIENSAAAKGILRTGGTLKGLADYSSNLASQEYQNAFNRAANVYGINLGANNQGFQNWLGAFNANTNANLGYGNLDLGRSRFGLDAQNQNWLQAYNTNNTNWDHQYKLTQLGMPTP